MSKNKLSAKVLNIEQSHRGCGPTLLWEFREAWRCTVLGRSWKAKVMPLLEFLFACSVFVCAGFPQTNQGQTGSAATQQPQPSATVATAPARPRIPAYLASRSVPNDKAVRLYRLVWGIDNIQVKQVSSGALIRFSFQVVDPNKAKVINNDKSTPLLIDEASHAALQIPVLEQIGKLRQTNTPEMGREYTMLFSNKGGYVRPGNSVSIVIGTFHVEGLIVQ